jgi:hypothetical protein
MSFAVKSGLALAPVLGLLLFPMGCTPNKSVSSLQEVKNVPPEPRDASGGHRFLPTGGNPEIALDTSSGTLCRTIEPTPGATDKYAELPICGAESSTPAVPITFAWDKALKEAPLSASCYRAKSLLPWYSETTPPTMRVTSGCIITNLTAKPEPLLGAVSYSGILREPDGKTTRRADVVLQAANLSSRLMDISRVAYG